MVFEGLVHRLSPKLKGIAHKLNGRFTFFNEDDLYQEALVHLWTDFQAGCLQDKTESYILQGCYFYLRNHIRKIQDKAVLVRLSVLSQDMGETEWEKLITSEPPRPAACEVDAGIFLRQIQTHVWSEREKIILSLSLEGLTTRDIGRRLGISHVAVVKMKNKIRGKCLKYRYLL